MIRPDRRERPVERPPVEIAELRPHREHHVGLEEQPIERRDHHPGGHAQRVARGHGTLAVDRQSDRRAEAPRQRERRGPRVAGAAAEDDGRPLGGRKQRAGTLDRLRGREGHRPRPRDGPRRGIGGEPQHVHRHLEVHRSGWAVVPLEHGPGGIERRAELAGLVDRHGQARHRSRERRLVGQIVDHAQAASALVPADGGREHQQGPRVLACLADRREDVGDAGPADHEADAGASRDAGEAVGHEAGALLVARRHVTHAARRQAAIQLQRVHARDAEDRVDAALGQPGDQRLADGRAHARPSTTAVSGRPARFHDTTLAA